MSPSQFHDHQNANGTLCQTTLKINKDSYFIKKSSPPSSSSSTSSIVNNLAAAAKAATAGPPPPKPQQRHPVIIYTHSPKIIHTHPRDFMALVQKLTGLSRADHNDKVKSETAAGSSDDQAENHHNNNKNKKFLKGGGGGIGSDDNESSSVITEENCCRDQGHQVNSCFLPPPILDPPNPYLSNIPLFAPPNSADFLCPNQPALFSYPDSLFFNPNNMRSSISSSCTLDGINELHDF